VCTSREVHDQAGYCHSPTESARGHNYGGKTRPRDSESEDRGTHTSLTFLDVSLLKR
jgi:hypothetical protein